MASHETQGAGYDPGAAGFELQGRDVAPAATSEPAAWIDFADNGNIRFWTADPARAKAEKESGRPLRMFTLAELVSLAARRTPSKEALVELIMRETTDDIVADGWERLGKPNVLVQGCKFIRRTLRTDATEGYQDPNEAARKFARFIAEAIIAESAKQ